MGKEKLKRPSAAIGHVFMKTVDIKTTTKFYVELGLRKILENNEMSIVELRGGTHLLFFKNSRKFKKPQKAKFDLMVDDVWSFHKELKKKKKKVSPIYHQAISGHNIFSVKDPDGRLVKIYSTHTDGRTV